jgi:Escherichia/Staphylococcus phage prohead protease
MTELRAELSSAEINDLPDDAFAYIESEGKKDADGKTTPRKLRHYPVHDKAHADNALSRANAQLKGGDDDAKKIAKAALPKIKAAAAKFAEAEEKKAAAWDAQHRDSGMSYNDLMSLLESETSAQFEKGKEDWVYVCDFGDDWLVFSQNGVKSKCSYELDGTKVTLGKPTAVRPSTTWVPIELKSSRDEPTPEDFGIAYSLKDAKMALAGVKAKQLADPDYQTDPDDKAVMAQIEAAELALDKAIIAQSKDGHQDPPARSSNPATPKRAFSMLVEQPPPHTIEAQVRMDESGSIAHFVGYPSPTGVAYSVRDWLGEYTETMDPGCYGKTLREQQDVPTLFNHDGVPMASTASSTKRLSEDGKGLREESEFDRRDALTNSIVVQLQRGVLSKMSISFRAIKDAWNDVYDDRHVGEAALYDTSIVTYPASPTASGELVEEMRSALGREGRSLWLAEHELSVRSALSALVRPYEGNPAPDGTNDLLERALRALVHADEVVSRSNGPHGRARTFLVAQAVLEIRAGKTLSAKNQGLLQKALDALSAADKQHAKLAASHAAAAGAVSDVLNGPSTPSASGGPDGKDSNQGAGNPIMPQDGAGPRSASLRLQREREAELRRLHR